VRRTVPPSAEIEAQIDQLLAVGVGENPRESLSELAKLGARLIIQRAVEDEFDAWLGRSRYERRPDHQRGLRNYESGLRNGFRPRTVQTAEGELQIDIPQVREAAETFASKLFPRTPKLLRTEPLKALVIGAFVRGLSMRDVESLCEQAGLGKLSESTASRICEQLRDRYEQFKRRDLYELGLVALFLDATFIAVRPDGPKEGVLVAWGFTEAGERVLLAVTLGMRESYEDWQALGRDLIARGLGAPMLIVADGAPRADQSDRAVLAGVRSPALLRAPRSQPLRQAANASANASSTPTGRRSMTRSTSATPSSDSKPSQASSTRAATPPPPDASPMTWTRSSCTCATRPGTAAGGGQRICSSAPSARSNDGPR
jgi:putative transposase